MNTLKESRIVCGETESLVLRQEGAKFVLLMVLMKPRLAPVFQIPDDY